VSSLPSEIKLSRRRAVGRRTAGAGSAPAFDPVRGTRSPGPPPAQLLEARQGLPVALWQPRAEEAVRRQRLPPTGERAGLTYALPWGSPWHTEQSLTQLVLPLPSGSAETGLTLFLSCSGYGASNGSMSNLLQLVIKLWVGVN